MMRTMGRAVTRAGVTGRQNPISPTSSSASNSPAPAAARARLTGSLSGSGRHVSANPCVLTSPFPAPYGYPFDEYGSDWDWVSADGSSSSGEKDVILGFAADDYLTLGPPPSVDEVHSAVNELSQFVGSGRYTSLVRDKYAWTGDEICWNPLPKSELDWNEASSYPSNTMISRHYETDTVHRAFHLLQNDQSVQRMVNSISSDPAIWNAVMNNEAVRELRQDCYPGDESNTNSVDESRECERRDR